jgi:hypothetical protein
VVILRGSEGRLRAGWRLALFVAIFLAALLGLSLLAVWLNAPWVSGAWPQRWAFVLPLLAGVFASWIMMERVERMPLAALGMPVDRLLPGSFGRGVAFGTILMGAVVLAMAAAGVLVWVRTPVAVGRGVMVFLELSAFMVLAAFAEELLLRGYLLQVMAEALGGPAAILVTAVVFAALHGLNPHISLLALANIALAGVLLGAALWRTMSLWFATGLHFGWNWTMGVLADLPVSGLDDSTPGFSFDTPGFDAVVDRASPLTGGAFGPEGSLLVTAATLAGIAWVVRSRRLQPALRVLALRPPALRRRGSGPRARE